MRETNDVLLKKINLDTKKMMAHVADLHADVIFRIEEEIKMVQKMRARDNADRQVIQTKNVERMSGTSDNIAKHSGYFHTLAVILATLIENVNM